MLITAPLGTLTTWAAPSIQPPTSACTQQLPSHPAQPTPLHTNSPTGASLSHSLHSTLSTHIQHILSLPWSLAKTIHPIQHPLARNTSSSALPTFLPAHTHTHTLHKYTPHPHPSLSLSTLVKLSTHAPTTPFATVHTTPPQRKQGADAAPEGWIRLSAPNHPRSCTQQPTRALSQQQTQRGAAYSSLAKHR